MAFLHGQKRNEDVLLQWSTGSEINTSDFAIEHSTNGTDWKTIARLPALGGDETNFYSYTHYTPVMGVNQYRIRQNDEDGRYRYSEIRTAQMRNEEATFEVISNPARNNTLQVRINAATKQTITLFGGDGKLIWLKELSPGVHTVDCNHRGKGIYILSSGDHTEKLVLQ